MTKHRSHSPAFKRQAAEEFIACKICTLSKRHDISGQPIRIWVGRFETRRLGRGRAGGLPNPEIWSQDHGFGVDGWTPGARDRAAKGALKHVLRVAGHPWPDGLVAEATRMTMPGVYLETFEDVTADLRGSSMRFTTRSGCTRL